MSFRLAGWPNTDRDGYRMATDVEGLTWGGQTYETSDGRIGGTLNVESRFVADGVDISDTEVVLLNF